MTLRSRLEREQHLVAALAEQAAADPHAPASVYRYVSAAETALRMAVTAHREAAGEGGHQRRNDPKNSDSSEAE